MKDIKKWKKLHESFLTAGATAVRRRSEKRKREALERLLSADVSTLKYERLRERLLYDYDFTCQSCGLKEWLGKPISLEVEHKDGNHHNNEYSNLTVLCPNCHAQTKTYRGRNKRGSKKFPTDEELLELSKRFDSIRQILLHCGMAGCGSNYQRMKDAIERLGIKTIIVR